MVFILSLTEISILSFLRHLQKQTNNLSDEKRILLQKTFRSKFCPGCTVCRHSAFLDDKKHIPFHHNRPYLLKQSVQACRKKSASKWNLFYLFNSLKSLRMNVCSYGYMGQGGVIKEFLGFEAFFVDLQIRKSLRKSIFYP